MDDRTALRTRTLVPIKAEILFTRRCPTLCSYCAITTATVKNKPDMPIHEWITGLAQLRRIGVSFLAIYGGEPTVRRADLPVFIREAKRLGFDLTVITACIGMTPDRWVELIQAGLDSVTVSLDAPPDAEYVEPDGQIRRTTAVLDSLSFVRTRVRDIEVVMTVSSSNLGLVLPMLDWADRMGYWVNFDLQHPDRGQPGSKCKGSAPAFEEDDKEGASAIFREVLRRKREGVRIHNSEAVLMAWANGSLFDYEWRCTDPFWLSVDCDGSMMYCDDSYDSSINQFSVTTLHARWEEFLTAWYAWRDQSTCHCAWATHFQAGEQVKSPDGPLSIAHRR